MATMQRWQQASTQTQVRFAAGACLFTTAHAGGPRFGKLIYERQGSETSHVIKTPVTGTMKRGRLACLAVACTFGGPGAAAVSPGSSLCEACPAVSTTREEAGCS